MSKDICGPLHKGGKSGLFPLRCESHPLILKLGGKKKTLKNNLFIVVSYVIIFSEVQHDSASIFSDL